MFVFFMFLCVLSSPSVHVKEDIETGALELTFDLPQFALLKPNPVFLLAFEIPLKRGNMDVTFTSESLQPGMQVNKSSVVHKT